MSPLVFKAAPAGGPAGACTLHGGSCTSESDCSSYTCSSGSRWDDLAPVVKTEYTCTTSDNVMLHMVRCSCPTSTAKRSHPVLLVPGLASSAEATWDILPRHSLFEHLARQGYDVWRVDLRGGWAGLVWFGGERIDPLGLGDASSRTAVSPLPLSHQRTPLNLPPPPRQRRKRRARQQDLGRRLVRR